MENDKIQLELMLGLIDGLRHKDTEKLFRLYSHAKQLLGDEQAKRFLQAAKIGYIKTILASH